MTQTEERLEVMKQKVANGAVPRKHIEDGVGILTRQKLVERLWNERRLTQDCSAPKKRAKKDRLLENQHQQQPQQQHIQQQQSQHQQIQQQNMQIHNHQHQQQSQPMLLQPTHESLQEDLSKRPRIMSLNTPTYSLNVHPGTHWTHHYPQH